VDVEVASQSLGDEAPGDRRARDARQQEHARALPTIAQQVQPHPVRTYVIAMKKGTHCDSELFHAQSLSLPAGFEDCIDEKSLSIAPGS
jgi:hypothetical protein